MESFFAGVSGWWPAGRADYHWRVIPDADEVSEHLTGPYRDLTGRSGLAPVAPEWCHITVLHGEPADEVGGHVMGQVTSRVRDRCGNESPFTARVRRPEAWRSAVVCPVYPGPAFRRLQTLVRSATAEVTGKPAAQEPLTYHPHLSIAYATARRGEGELRDWLSDHDLPEPPIRVGALTLVKQAHDSHAITWSVVDVIPLGAAG